MEKYKRKIFFWLLATIFLVVAPVVVMRARGFRFDLNRGVFVHSGTISVKSNPQNVKIMVNGEPAESNLNRINSSFNISGLMPGDYEISVQADGFQSWNKKIDVHSGMASEFWNVLLVRNDYQDTSYSTGGIENYFISHNNGLAAYTNEDSINGTNINILSIDDKSIVNSFHFDNAIYSKEEREENIEWSPEANYLSIPFKVTKEIKTLVGRKEIIETVAEYVYYIIDIGPNETFNLNEFLGKNDIRKVRWDPSEKDYLFFQSENNLYRASIRDVSDLILIASDVSSYDLSKSGIYYTQMPNELVFQIAPDGQSQRNQLTSSFPEENKAETDKFIVYDTNRMAFIDKQKNLFVYNSGDHDRYFRKLSANVEGLQFSDDGKKMLFWTGNEISVYFLRDWNVQPLRVENEVQNITRYSTEIKNVQWFKDYEHVIFNTDKTLKIIELDSRDHFNSMDILQIGLDESLVVYNHNLEYLFFIDKKGEIPDLYTVNIPEETTILGF
jgi:hypothetical protein